MALRVHFASLLSEAGNAKEALEQASAVLARDPAHIEALKIASNAAMVAGDTARAEGYRKLYDALSWNSAKGMIDSIPEETPREEEPIRLGGEREPEEALLERWVTERPEVKLADVAGMTSVKKRLQTSFLGPLNNPELRKLYGKSLRGGLLLYGPPGCGKTFFARAVAGELGAKFLSIGITDVVDMWLGNSEKNLHELFQTARRSKPCVLFMDELDALGRKRSLMRHHAGAGLINQLLAELDGVEYDNEGVYFLAATNHPWDVDTALRRPGRLDRMVLVLPPDPTARESILRSTLRERPVGQIDYRAIVDRTEDFSGADVVHLCETAAEFALEESIEKGTTRPIQMADFKKALAEVKPSTRQWFEAAKNFAIYANEGGVYDDLLSDLKRRRLV
ncbi:MAG TPA: ATP-binding protein [Fimbriimonas sp.]